MKVLIFVVATIFIVLVIYLGISAYIATVLTVPGQSPLVYDETKIGERVTDVAFKASDGLPLSGWYFPGTNDKAILFVHGAGNQNRANEVYGAPEIAKHFVGLGYTVLMFDLRGTGESAKTRISFGEYEKNDVEGAFEYLVTQDFKPQSIGIISDSLGAISTIMASSVVKIAGGIVLDSPATEVKPIVSKIMTDENNVPRILHPGAFFLAKLLYKIDIDSVRPIDKISQLKSTPLLFLHGENDTLIPPSNSELLMEQVDEGTRILFPDSGHVETYTKHPEQYLSEVTKFFDVNLKK